MTLREEVEKYFKDLDKIFHEANVAQIGHCVLKFIDQHEADRKEYGQTRCTRCHRDVSAYCVKCWEGYDKRDERSKPSEERPARDMLSVYNMAHGCAENPTLGNALLIGVEAIIEAVEESTAAIREAKR